MPISHDTEVSSTENRADLPLRGHKLLFRRQQAAILDFLDDAVQHG